MTTRKVVITIILLVMLVATFFASFIKLGTTTPSIVGTSTSTNATSYPFQRKSFYTQGRFWVFYSDGTYMTYRTSLDGVSWSGATAVRSSSIGYYFDVFFDGVYLHYIYAPETFGGDLIYRRGTPNANGSITWSTAEQIAYDAASSETTSVPSIAVDSNGYAFIVFLLYDINLFNHYLYVTKNNNTDGTWTTTTNFPKLLKTGIVYGISLSLTEGKMYFLYGMSANKALGRLWTGSTLGSEEEVSSSVILSITVASAINEGDNIHFVFLKDSSYDLIYVKRTYGVGWGTETTIQTTTTSTSAPVLSINASTLYCFWAGSPTANHIYYKRCIAGTWDSSPTDWINESTDGLTNNARLTCFYQAWNNYIGLVYMTKTSSPYNVKFAFLFLGTTDTTPPSYSNAGTNTTIVGQPCKFHVKWTDNIGLSGFIFGSDVSGAWQNDTWVSMSGTSNWSNVTKTLPTNEGVTVQWRVRTNDTSNNWGDTGIKSFKTSYGIVGTTTIHGIGLSKQRKTFYATGLFWAFYLDGTNIVYRTSVDGLTWSSSTTVRAGQGSTSVYFDGTYLHYVFGSSARLYYRQGLPNSNGTITWSAAEQSPDTIYNYCVAPFISVDTNGYVWISYTDFAGGWNEWYPYVIKSANNDGTWGTTPSGFPYKLTTLYDNNFETSIVPLTGGKMFVIYGYSGTPYYARRWVDPNWSSQIQTSRTTGSGCFHSLIAEGDNAHLVWKHFDGIIHSIYSYATHSFGTEVVVQSGSPSPPILSRSTLTNELYCFWNDYPTDDHVYYKKYVNGIWDSSAIDWIDESTEKMVSTQALSCSYLDYGNKIGLLFQTKVTQPYNIKFAFLEMVDTLPPTFSNIGTNTTMAGNPCAFHLLWQDNVGLSGFIFGWNGTGEFENDTWTNPWTGTPTSGWANVTKTLPGSSGVRVDFQYLCNDTSNNWGDTDLYFLTTTEVMIEVYATFVIKNRIDINTNVTVYFRHRFNTNQSYCTSGLSYINGTQCNINGTGWASRTISYATVGKRTFTITAVNVTGVTSFQMVTSNIEVIWDRLQVESCGVGDNRADVNSQVLFWWKLKYQYDNVAFTSAKGSCSIGGVQAVWSTIYNRWQRLVTLPITPQLYNQTLTFIDNTYGLTQITGTTTQFIIADKVIINSFSVVDDRINVGDTASFSVSGIYAYDSTAWSGTYTLNNTATKTIVGKYGYSIQSITDSNYGLTAFQQDASSLSVIFDKLTVTFSANNLNPLFGETVTISWTIKRQYDNSDVASFTIGITRDGILWQTLTNNSITDMSTTKVTRTYTLNTIIDNTYGITVASANSVIVAWVPHVPYQNPPIISEITWFMRSDSHTVNTVPGYILSENPTSSSTYKQVSTSGDLVAYYGWRIWVVHSGTETELTTNIAYSWRVEDGYGTQNVLWNCLSASLQLDDAVKIILYVKLGDGNWTAQAIFISSQLGYISIAGSEWGFKTYTKRSYSGGVTTATVYWGGNYETAIAGIEFVEPDIYDTMRHKLNTGDFIGFVLAPYLNLVGNLFYGLVMLIICVPIYNRYRSLTPIIILFIIFGGAGGIFSLLVPEVGFSIGWILLLLGLAGLLYKVFR